MDHPAGDPRGAGIVIGQPDTGVTGHGELEGAIEHRVRELDARAAERQDGFDDELARLRAEGERRIEAEAQARRRAERKLEQLDRQIPIGPDDFLPNSPFSQTRLGRTASIAELCEATITTSDNAAANLLLAQMEGPAGLTRFIRRQADLVTRLDRTELALNEARPGDPRDTTTPIAMATLFERLAFGSILTPPSRTQFIRWLVKTETGLKRLRGGIPADWRAGDKTGAGNGCDNDVAIFWPPGRKPIVVASYIAGTTLDFVGSNAIHARLGALITVAVRSEGAIQP